MTGKVYLIGAGPGDPGLLTLKGLACLQKADVLVYDALIHPKLLSWVRPSTQKIFVGKRGSHHSMEQHHINRLLADHALKGRVVARLKGGDPFVFGRGSEEAAFLHDRHIPFEVVSGVTSATGALAYAGIPLTDRSKASMVTLVTGHPKAAKNKKKNIAASDDLTDVEWQRISRKSTLVIFMGLEQLPTIMFRLQKHLWPKTMPAAVIYWGSTSEQKVIVGTIGDIDQKTKEAQLNSPVLIVIGEVVKLRPKLQWFEKLPLFGKTIVITRAYEQAMEFSNQLEAQGAQVLAFPTIQFTPPSSWEGLDTAIENILEAEKWFQWIIFTSAQGVKGFFDRFYRKGADIRELSGIRIAAVGPKTSAALTERGLRVELLPDDYTAESLGKSIPIQLGERVLLPRAEVAPETLPLLLQKKGALVTTAPCYRTQKTTRITQDVRHALLEGKVNVITFTSSSTVHNFMLHFSKRDLKKIFDRTLAAAIGPVTAKTLRSYGIHPKIQSKRFTTEALTKALVQHFE